MEDARKATKPLKGRGSASRPVGRFEAREATGEDDGWGSVYSDLADAPPLSTNVAEEVARSIVTRNTSPDIGFNQSVNGYRGCEHGCAYCFARPSHSYLGHSPGLDFETKLYAKTNGPELLRQELSKRSYRCEPIALGINTDSYQPIERRLRLTRRLLEVLQEFNHPLTIVTKGGLIERDIDLLGPMAAKGLVHVHFSVTTLDNRLASRLEPRATAPAGKLRAMAALGSAGIPVGVMVAPVIPAITDHELESILGAARDNGACGAGYVILRLPHELLGLWTEWLELHFPDRTQHVLSMLRQLGGGDHYDSRFGIRMRGQGPIADLLQQRFSKAVRSLGFPGMPELNSTLFSAPAPVSAQRDLFG